MEHHEDTHSVVLGYAFWLFGFFGLHRFYYGKPLTGILWALTGGLLLIGWIVDLFLIPAMDAVANRRYRRGRLSHSLAWIFLVLLGYLGAHRFYQEKWISAIIYLLTGGLCGLGVLYDLLTLNEQIEETNAAGPISM